jgi:hypothetical protein
MEKNSTAITVATYHTFPESEHPVYQAPGDRRKRASWLTGCLYAVYLLALYAELLDGGNSSVLNILAGIFPVALLVWGNPLHRYTTILCSPM